MSKYDDVMCFYFSSEDTKKVYPYSFVFFCGPFKQFWFVKVKGKRAFETTPFIHISIERLKNAVLFDDDCYEKRVKNNRSSE